jgi:hypothetical protein
MKAIVAMFSCLVVASLSLAGGGPIVRIERDADGSNLRATTARSVPELELAPSSGKQARIRINGDERTLSPDFLERAKEQRFTAADIETLEWIDEELGEDRAVMQKALSAAISVATAKDMICIEAYGIALLAWGGTAACCGGTAGFACGLCAAGAVALSVNAIGHCLPDGGGPTPCEITMCPQEPEDVPNCGCSCWGCLPPPHGPNPACCGWQ